MQKLILPDNYIHPLFSDLAYMYQEYSTLNSENNGVLVKRRVNQCLKPITRLFERHSALQSNLEYNETTLERLKTPRASKKIILAFSGGKDSTATAIWLKQHGYDVTLYHLRGINQTYKDEYKNAQTVADKLELPLVVETCKLSGSHEWIEHPMKNMMIAVAMLQYGIRTKLTAKVAFGNFSTSSLDYDPFEVCGGDCKEAWQAFTEAVRAILPSFQMLTPLESMKDTLDILMQNKDVAILCQSCIGPYRYRDYLHDRNVKKYSIDFPAHRCGSCWKCCLEYIVYTDNDMYNYNRNFYEHCLNILKKTIYAESGARCSIDEVWNHYFFYDQTQSKYFTENLSLTS